MITLGLFAAGAMILAGARPALIPIPVKGE